MCCISERVFQMLILPYSRGIFTFILIVTIRVKTGTDLIRHLKIKFPCYWIPHARVHSCFPAGQSAGGWDGILRHPPLGLCGSFRLARCGECPRALQLQRLPDGLQKHDGQFWRVASHQRRRALRFPRHHIFKGRLLTCDQPASVLRCTKEQRPQTGKVRPFWLFCPRRKCLLKRYYGWGLTLVEFWVSEIYLWTDADEFEFIL